MSTAESLGEIYQRLFARYGPQHWWPAETDFEVIVGAVLTQNTNWQNVKKAIENLRGAGVLSPERMVELPEGLLAEYIRPSGYYNIKAKRLLNLVHRIHDAYGSDLETLFSLDTATLREFLLSVKGIGPETADSILLYAARHPVFVVDAYTYRILVRHNLLDEENGYPEMQSLFMDNLAPDTELYNEFHALLVRVGKEYCRKTNPRCSACPLNGF